MKGTQEGTMKERQFQSQGEYSLIIGDEQRIEEMLTLSGRGKELKMDHLYIGWQKSLVQL